MRFLSPYLAVILLASAALLSACGGPALQNVPKPDPGIVAGLAAGVAGAATLADPQGAARHQESKKQDPAKHPMKKGPSVPSDVLDRLDAHQKDGGTTEPAGPPPPPGEASGVVSPVPLKKH